MTVSWSDEDVPERDDESKFIKHVIAMTGRVLSDTESCDEELAYDELAASYKGFYVRSVEICKMLEEQKKINSQLLDERSNHLVKTSELNDEVTLLNSQLEHVKKQVKMMTTGTEVLDEILEGQVKGKPNGIGFDYNPLNQKQQNRNFAYAPEEHGMIRKQKQDKDINYVVATGINTASTSKTMLQHSGEQHSSQDKKVTCPWILHHCKRKGHIRPFCFKLYGYPQFHVQPKVSGKIAQAMKEWRPKTPNVSSFVTSSVSISASPALTKFGNLV